MNKDRGREGASRTPHGPRTRLALQLCSVPGVEDWARAPPALTPGDSMALFVVLFYINISICGVLVPGLTRRGGRFSTGLQVFSRGIFIAVKIKGWGQPCVPQGCAVEWQGGFSGTATPLMWLSPTQVPSAWVVALVFCSKQSWGWCWGCHRVSGPCTPLDVTCPARLHLSHPSHALGFCSRSNMSRLMRPVSPRLHRWNVTVPGPCSCTCVTGCMQRVLPPSPPLPVRAPNAE